MADKISTLGPLKQGVTPADVEKRKQAEATTAATAPGFLDALSMDREQTNLLPNVQRLLANVREPYDPNMKMTPEFWTLLSDGVQPQYHEDLLSGAKSVDSAYAKKREILEKQHTHEELSKMSGYSQVGVGIINSLTDPAALAVGIATGGTATPWLLAGRAGRAVHGAIASAAANVGMDSVVLAGGGFDDPKQLLYSAAAGGLIGGAVGAVSKGVTSTWHTGVHKVLQEITAKTDMTPFRNAIANIESRGSGDYAAIGVPTKNGDTALGRYQIMESNLPEWSRKALGREVSREEFLADPKIQDTIFDHQFGKLMTKYGTAEDAASAWLTGRPRATAGKAEDALGTNSEEYVAKFQANLQDPNIGDSVGAMRSRIARNPHENLELGDQIEALRGTKAWGGKLRGIGPIQSEAARLKNHENVVMKWAGHNLVEDSVEGGQPSAALIADAETHYHYGNYQAEFEDAYAVYKQELRTKPDSTMAQQVFGLQDAQIRDQFNLLIHEELHGVPSGNPHVSRVVSQINKNNASILEKLKQAGVTGADEVQTRTGYLAREWNPEQFRTLSHQFGTDAIERLLVGAVRNASENIPEELADRFAKAIYKRFNNAAGGADPNGIQRLFGSDNIDQLSDFLDELNLTKSDMKLKDDIIAHFKQQDEVKLSSSSTAGNLKSRINLDESYSELLTDTAGNTHRVSVFKLLNQNASQVHANYIRRMSGHIGLAKKGIKGNAEYKELVRKIEKEGYDLYKNDPDGSAKIADSKKELEVIYNSLLGRPVESMNRHGASALRLARNWNFARLMGQVGLASVSELGTVASSIGLRAMIQHMPSLDDLIRGGIKGAVSVDDEAFRSVEDLVGLVGKDRLLNPPSNMAREVGMQVGTPGSKLDQLNTGMQYVNRAVADLSGHNVITSNIQRLAATGIAQKFVNMAHGSRFNPKRLEYLGLDSEMLPRVLDQIKKHTILDENVETGRKLRDLNMIAWDDQEAAEAFRFANYREARRIVQKNLLGETPMFLNTEYGKTLFQFRSFAIAAWDKQLLHNVRMADMESAKLVLYTTFMGSLAYYAQTMVNAQGREDKQEFLKRHLSVEAIAKGAFMKAGYSSLIPGIIDTVAFRGAIYKPQFEYGRSTGQESSFITGNPTVGLLEKSKGALEAGAGLLLNPDYKFSKKNINDITGLLAFSNSYGFKNAIELLKDKKPSRSLKPKQD